MACEASVPIASPASGTRSSASVRRSIRIWAARTWPDSSARRWASVALAAVWSMWMFATVNGSACAAAPAARAHSARTPASSDTVNRQIMGLSLQVLRQSCATTIQAARPR